MTRTPAKKKLDLRHETIRQIGRLELAVARGGGPAAIAYDTGADTSCPLPHAGSPGSATCNG